MATKKKTQKQTRKPKAEVWQEVNQVPSTAQGMANGFEVYSKAIRDELAKLDHRQDHPELGRSLYNQYRPQIERWSEIARTDLKDCPDFGEVPSRAPEESWYGGLTKLAEFCERCAARMKGKPDKTPALKKVVKQKQMADFKPLEGHWSKPMSKSTMMAALKIDSPKTFNAFAARFGIQEAGNRQTFIIRLDKMDENTRSKLEKK